VGASVSVIGRKRISKEIRDPIFQMVAENGLAQSFGEGRATFIFAGYAIRHIMRGTLTRKAFL